ncbi:hypothetical protein Tdes44962_MAKER04136 [Teratosphaeria destructans]|uniref:Uncharacterized protein n=1 Tax=Teratosphaeria destructans TaxID=418781 RepID=A0A9W7SNR4_9PEZI|nr:hypothetical protein Tdes44962_MAKER04136 [Teratosphaeria destructans]
MISARLMSTGKHGLGPDHGCKKRTVWLADHQQRACVLSPGRARDAHLDCNQEVHQAPPGSSSRSRNNTYINATRPDTADLISTLLDTTRLRPAFGDEVSATHYPSLGRLGRRTKRRLLQQMPLHEQVDRGTFQRKGYRRSSQRSDAKGLQRSSLTRDKKGAWSLGPGGSWAKSGGRRVSITAMGGPGLETAGSLPILKALRLGDDKGLLH